jgi:diguanylate cyclase (GGDEF)-like protein
MAGGGSLWEGRLKYDAVQSRLFRVIEEGVLSAREAVRSLLETEPNDPQIHAKVVASLLSVSLDSARARDVLRDLLVHHAELAERLGSEIDIRVSAMSYAVEHPDLVGNPVVVDQDLLTLSQRLAAVDELTGVYNRRFLDVYLTKEIHRAHRHGNVFSILFLDLDNFKLINDRHGHDVGDRVLASFGREVQALLRTEDFAARYGGEEFVVVMPQTETEGALRFAERLATRLARTEFPNGLAVTASGGIASFPQHGTSAESLVHASDMALYQAKQNGKAHARVAPPEKRSTDRHPASVPVVCYTDDMELGELTLHDVSEAGLSAMAGTDLQPGQMIRIRVRSAISGQADDVYARVVWSHRVSDSIYRIGGRWTETDRAAVEAVLSSVAGL